MVKPAASP